MSISSPNAYTVLQDRTQHHHTPRLTITTIVTTAIEIADNQGLDAVSMRRVAHHLGVGTMSLYGYLSGRSELVHRMVDTICARIAQTGHQPHHGWRRRLADCARDDLAAHLRHPWLSTAHNQTTHRGPGCTAKYDRELASIDHIGLTDSEMATVISLVTAHVQASATRRLAHTLKLPRQPTDAQHTPTAHRIATTGTDDGFEFGLDRILDGITAIIRTR